MTTPRHFGTMRTMLLGAKRSKDSHEIAILKGCKSLSPGLSRNAGSYLGGCRISSTTLKELHRIHRRCLVFRCLLPNRYQPCHRHPERMSITQPRVARNELPSGM